MTRAIGTAAIGQFLHQKFSFFFFFLHERRRALREKHKIRIALFERDSIIQQVRVGYGEFINIKDSTY